MDLIERQAAIDALEKWLHSLFGITEADGTATIFKTIRQLPPIQPNLLQPWEVLVAQAVLPQPEIIRCKDCKFASGDSRICMKFGHSQIGELDFCAWAERRTDD